MLDKSKLGKLLEQTTSDNDSEALASIRLANRLLADAELTWTTILEKFEGEVPWPHELHPQPHIALIDTLLKHPNMTEAYRVRLEYIRRRFVDFGSSHEDEGAIKRIRLALNASER